ncbi:MAG: aminotransferase class IV [Desulfovibrionaceae bacterium]|nr:aminotransferase class IV [Desulfovibrionaceae bacterium]
MLPILSGSQWLQKVQSTERPNAERILAFYEQRIGAICKDPACLLAPLDDHLVHRGDGVFETIRFSQGKIFNLEAHLRRFAHSAQGLAIEPPCPEDALRAIILDVARAADSPEGNIRVLMGRGPGGFGIEPSECQGASLYVIAYAAPAHSEEWYAKGLTACRSAIPVRQAAFAQLKTANYLPGVLMCLEAAKKGADLSFSFDEDGNLAEGAVSNIAIVDAAGCFATPLFRNALPGTTVRKAAELASAFMPAASRPIPEAELFTAREILVLGTSIECASAVRYENHPVGSGRPGPVAAKLRQLIHEDMLANGTPF